MNKGPEMAVRGGCAGFRLTQLVGAMAVAACGSGALGDPIADRGFFGPEATMIDFETDGSGSPVLSPDTDPLLDGETLLLPANEYAPMGVAFGSDIYWVNDGNPLFDAAQTLSSMDGQGGSPTLAIPSSAVSSFDILFTTPVDAFGFFVADNTSAAPRSGVSFEAYDAADQLVDMQSFGGAFVDDTLSNAQGEAEYGFMGIVRGDGQDPIARVTVTKGAAILDDLVFTPIPSPGAAGLLGAAGLMTACRRRRVSV